MTMLSETETFLKAYHAKHPGCTPQAMSDGITTDGYSSYDLLTNLVPTESTKSTTVLDLACGDGFLLERLFQRAQPGLRLVGVDMSDGELAVAKKRLEDRVELHQGKAQAIPLPDMSVDFVTCHMALMLMDSIEDVIAEIHRVLKPGGTFSAVVGCKGPKTGANDTFIRLLDEALNAEGLTFLSRLGDPRVRKDEGIRALFSSNSGFVEPVKITEHVLALDLSADKATDFFMLTYDPELLSAVGIRTFENKLHKELELIVDGRGLIACPTGLRQFTCEREK